jgi:hypothetical protein
MELIKTLVFAFLIIFGLVCNKSHSQNAHAGTYSILTLGTAGSHAVDPGSVGTMTVLSGGRVAGSVYSYADGTTSAFIGRVDLVSGKGTITEGGTTYYLTFRTFTRRTVVNVSYSKTASASKGVLWGVSPRLPLPAN